jgi:hypothetical protein
MAARGEADGRVGQAEPIEVVVDELGDDLAQEGQVRAGHDEAVGDALGVGGGGDEVELAQRLEAASAVEVHVHEYACRGRVNVCVRLVVCDLRRRIVLGWGFLAPEAGE